MGINYKGSQGQTERAIALQSEEEVEGWILLQNTFKPI